MADRSGHWISAAKRAAIVACDGLECAYCGRRCTRTRAGATGGRWHRKSDATLDHVTARPLGGSHAATNVVVACSECNARKGALSWDAWCALLFAEGVDIRAMVRRVRDRLAAHDAIEARFGRRSAISDVDGLQTGPRARRVTA